MSTEQDRNGAKSRLRHAFTAGLLALLVSFLGMFEPLDQLAWAIQSRIASVEASGEIIYVGASDDLTDPNFPHRRLELAETLDTLREAGADRVYLDMVFDRSTDAATDQALNEALRSLDGRAFLVRNFTTGLNGEAQFDRSVPAIADDVSAVGSDMWQTFLGYSWSMPYQLEDNGERISSLPASLAGIAVNTDENFPVNYSFDLASIPAVRFQGINPKSAPLGFTQTMNADVAGKIVVIGNANRGDSIAPNIPGHLEVPASMVSIYAAETLKAGFVKILSDPLVLFFVFALLALVCQWQSRQWRYAMYAVIAISLPAAFVVTAYLSIKIYVSSALVFLLVFMLTRARVHWQSNMRLIDADTNLPTFAALESDKNTAVSLPTIIVAKIHRFEEVRRTLPKELHGEYMIRIISRLKAAKKDATIYVGPGHLIAWTITEKEPALIKEHLEGLRALFSAPLLVGENQVDVGITFGVDISLSPNVTRRIAAAVSAAERTTQTYEPIEIAEPTSDEDLIWNISLQARIDAALSNGEIYMIYQPKILVQTGELVGVESLVRWRDPVKGLIPPDHFIPQIENAGRMTQLTRHVLREACEAGNAFEDRGLKIPVAVNISATLVHERDIVDMVRDVLADTGFDPHCLTLEITETYRISNFEAAEEILSDLAALGAKISMDDFGVGAASLEALQRLPFSELKIDRVFTAAMKDNPKAAGIVRNVLRLGKDLRIIVVAEGVEDAETLTLLRDSGCLVAQGFGISRPAPFDEIIKFQKVSSEERLRNMV